jgi:4-hydroxybenzoate polyprenyltransferase
MKTKSPYLKLQGYLFLVIYGVTFVRLAWLMIEGANPRPILFLMACCAVWFALIGLITALVEKNMQKQKRERERGHR